MYKLPRTKIMETPIFCLNEILRRHTNGIGKMRMMTSPSRLMTAVETYKLGGLTHLYFGSDLSHDARIGVQLKMSIKVVEIWKQSKAPMQI